MGTFLLLVMIIVGSVGYAGVQLWRAFRERAFPPDQRTALRFDGPMMVAAGTVFCVGSVAMIIAVIMVDPRREANIGAGIGLMMVLIGSISMWTAFLVPRLASVMRGLVSLLIWMFLGKAAMFALFIFQGILEQLG